MSPARRRDVTFVVIGLAMAAASAWAVAVIVNDDRSLETQPVGATIMSSTSVAATSTTAIAAPSTTTTSTTAVAAPSSAPAPVPVPTMPAPEPPTSAPAPVEGPAPPAVTPPTFPTDGDDPVGDEAVLAEQEAEEEAERANDQGPWSDEGEPFSGPPEGAWVPVGPIVGEDPP